MHRGHARPNGHPPFVKCAGRQEHLERAGKSRRRVRRVERLESDGPLPMRSWDQEETAVLMIMPTSAQSNRRLFEAIPSWHQACRQLPVLQAWPHLAHRQPSRTPECKRHPTLSRPNVFVRRNRKTFNLWSTQSMDAPSIHRGRGRRSAECFSDARRTPRGDPS